MNIYFLKNPIQVDTLWKVANMYPQPVTRMKCIDAISQHSEHSHMKAVPKRDCCTPASEEVPVRAFYGLRISCTFLSRNTEYFINEN